MLPTLEGSRARARTLVWTVVLAVALATGIYGGALFAPAQAATSVTVVDSALLAGQKATLRGDLGATKRPVRLQRASGGSWSTVRTGWTTTTGTFTVADSTSRVGTYRLYAPGGTYSGNRVRSYVSSNRKVIWQTSISAGTTLKEGYGIRSATGRYLAVMQTDGNFVVYDRSTTPAKTQWSSATNTTALTRAVLQTDGNFVIYTGSTAKWSSATAPGTGVRLVMQTDGNLVMYSKGNIALWSTYGGKTRNTSDSLTPESRLKAGNSLYSIDGRYRAVMQGDGNFVVYAPGGVAKWSSATGVDGSSIVLQGDGNLVVYTPGGVAKWSSATAPARAVRLVMQSDGNLVMYSRGGLALWASGGGKTGYSESTLPTGTTLGVGQALWSHDGRFQANMQGDGNFVVYGPTGAMWASGTGVSGSTLRMQSDGNLVVYAPGSVAKWNSATQGANARVVMQDDGNLVVYSGGTALWSSYGNGAPGAGGGAGGYPDADATPCPEHGFYSWCKNGNVFHPVRKFAYRNCTDYVAWKKGMVWGDIQYNGSGHAYQWKAGWQARGRAVSTVPKVGAVAWWPASTANKGYGHVAYVLAVNPDGSAHVGEYNGGGNGTYGEKDVRAPYYLY